MKDMHKNIVIAVPMEEVKSIIEVLKEHDIDAGLSDMYKSGYAFDSAIYDVVIHIIDSPAFLPAVSVALRAYLKRNDKKKFTIKTEKGEIINLDGRSNKEIKELLKKIKRLSIIEKK